jgi:hypothetical protein
VHAPRTSLLACLTGLGLGCQGSTGGVVTSGNDEETAALVLTTSAAGTLATTGVALTVTDSDRQETYLENRREIAIALARGRGSYVDDLADELGLPEGMVAHLGAVLKARRDRLAPRLEDKVLRDDWERWLADELCCDPWIRPFASSSHGCTRRGDAPECAL